MGLNISIHAPREGCDGTRRRAGTSCSTISIHAPREGCDLLLLTSGPPAPHFNPRTPRGVRRGGMSAPMRGGDFNPRTPRGVRPVARTQRPGPNVFQSTHPARGATSRRADMPSVREFQSTHPARGATIGCRGHSVLHHGISIHAPREGCDRGEHRRCLGGHNFNPRTPRGVRRYPGRLGR